MGEVDDTLTCLRDTARHQSIAVAKRLRIIGHYLDGTSGGQPWLLPCPSAGRFDPAGVQGEELGLLHE
ncbi:hypothetical protein A7U43_27770 (plasmid) [Mycobacterium adipatum]|uniref:Uncharacterized protein n=1 Tax=Mycobacterium adipatum TaxID=1682113 RepID=A0A172UWC7_9MYCO|nr:hypothetical protein A7U43_27770 [Mycobacterium adipatum]